MGQPHSTVQGQPAGELVLIFQEKGFDVSPYHLALTERRIAAIAGHNSEKLVVARAEDLESDAGIVFSAIDGQRSHAADVVGSAVVLGNDDIGIGFADDSRRCSGRD